MKIPISNSLIPNLTSKDVKSAFLMMLTPWKWKHGNQIEEAKTSFAAYLGVSSNNVFLFDKARSALHFGLESFGIGEGDEVIIQAYTCVVVPNAIIAAGAKPVYVDIEKDSLNINPGLIEEKITKKTKAIVVQHNFGLPSSLNKILELARTNNLILIEDSAHSLGAEYKNNRLGTVGDFAIFSFGRDKIISSVNGGALVVNNKSFLEEIKNRHEQLFYSGWFYCYQCLLHPLFFVLIAPVSKLLISKVLIVAFQKLKLLNVAYEKEERFLGKQSSPKKFPNALAGILKNQINYIDKFNKHRNKIAKIYDQGLASFKKDIKVINPALKKGGVAFRYTLLIDRPKELYNEGKKHSIVFGNWYESVIMPKDSNLKNVFYDFKSCPIAEDLAKKSINLPTAPRVTEKDARYVVEFLKKYFLKK